MIFEYAHNLDYPLKKPHLIDEDKYDPVNLHYELREADKKIFQMFQVHLNIVDQHLRLLKALPLYLENKI